MEETEGLLVIAACLILFPVAGFVADLVDVIAEWYRTKSD